MAIKIAVATNKGGVLKTSITVNLAGSLAKDGYKVLLIDTDNQGDVAVSFGYESDDISPNLYHLLMGEASMEECIYQLHDNIDCIPSNDEIASLDFEVLQNREKYPHVFELMRNTFVSLEAKYDFILFDTPPNLGLIVGNVLSIANYVLIPFHPEAYSNRALRKTVKNIKQFESLNPKLSILGVVATKIDWRTNLHKDMLSIGRQYCYENDITMFDTVIRNSIKTPNSVAYEGLPITLMKAKKHEREILEVQTLYEELKGEILSCLEA